MKKRGWYYLQRALIELDDEDACVYTTVLGPFSRRESAERITNGAKDSHLFAIDPGALLRYWDGTFFRKEQPETDR